MSNQIHRTRTHRTTPSKTVTTRRNETLADSHERVISPRTRRNRLVATTAGVLAVVGLGVGMFANSKMDEHERKIDKYQVDKELLVNEDFNNMTDEQLKEAGYTVLRAGDGEILSKFSQRVGEQLAVDPETAIELVRDQGITRDGNPAFGAGERFIFVGPPEQPQP